MIIILIILIGPWKARVRGVNLAFGMIMILMLLSAIRRAPSWACRFRMGVETQFCNCKVLGPLRFCAGAPPQTKGKAPPHSLIRTPPFAKVTNNNDSINTSNNKNTTNNNNDILFLRVFDIRGGHVEVDCASTCIAGHAQGTRFFCAVPDHSFFFCSLSFSFCLF